MHFILGQVCEWPLRMIGLAFSSMDVFSDSGEKNVKSA